MKKYFKASMLLMGLCSSSQQQHLHKCPIKEQIMNGDEAEKVWKKAKT